MDISVGENNELRLKNAFNPVIFETDECEELIVCMRDGAFEIAVIDDSEKPINGIELKSYNWYTASKKGIRPLHPIGISDKNVYKGDSNE